MTRRNSSDKNSVVKSLKNIIGNYSDNSNYWRYVVIKTKAIDDAVYERRWHWNKLFIREEGNQKVYLFATNKGRRFDLHICELYINLKKKISNSVESLWLQNYSPQRGKRRLHYVICIETKTQYYYEIYHLGYQVFGIRIWIEGEHAKYIG